MENKLKGGDEREKVKNNKNYSNSKVRPNQLK